VNAFRYAFVAVLAGVLAAAVAGLGYAGSRPSASAQQYEYGAKVTICHHTGSKKNPQHTITVSRNALPAHLRHGDTVGPCTSAPTVSTTVTTQTSPAKGSDKGEEQGKGNGKGKGKGK
jgi:hypothetical protein